MVPRTSQMTEGAGDGQQGPLRDAWCDTDDLGGVRTSTSKAMTSWWGAHKQAVKTLTFHGDMLVTEPLLNACDLLPGDLRAVSGIPRAPDSKLQSALMRLYEGAGELARDCAGPDGVSTPLES